MTCAEIRRRFVEYYQNAGFQQLPRASMLHPSIPLSFVMSAGLVQVEEVLLHSQERSNNRFVLVQDCFRHFDLKAIGTDGIHLSLFEMPIAFVFGTDGHQELIARMWEFAVSSLRLDPQRIWIGLTQLKIGVQLLQQVIFWSHKLPVEQNQRVINPTA